MTGPAGCRHGPSPAGRRPSKFRLSDHRDGWTPYARCTRTRVYRMRYRAIRRTCRATGQPDLHPANHAHHPRIHSLAGYRETEQRAAPPQDLHRCSLPATLHSVQHAANAPDHESSPNHMETVPPRTSKVLASQWTWLFASLPYSPANQNLTTLLELVILSYAHSKTRGESNLAGLTGDGRTRIN